MLFEKEFLEELDQYKYGIGIDNEIVLANSEVISVEKLLNWKLPTLNDYVVYKSGRSRDYMNRRMFSDLVRFKQYCTSTVAKNNTSSTICIIYNG